MFQGLLSLLVPFDRFCANVLLNLLRGLWIDPTALPPSVLGHLHEVTAASRIGRGRYAARVNAVQTADWVVSQLAAWIESANGPPPGSFITIEPLLEEVFAREIPQHERETIANARHALVSQELMIRQRSR